MRRNLLILALVAVIGLALGLRFCDLGARPVHHDEGVNGWFIGNLIENGEYHYAPQHFHGPTLFYLGSFFCRVGGINIFAMRSLTAFFGVLICFLPLLLRRELGRSGTLAAMLALAVSPSQVYYARYAIHEILFAAFVGLFAVTLFKFWTERRGIWLVVNALALAAAAATKETVIVPLAAIGGGAGVLWLSLDRSRRRISWKGVLLYPAIVLLGLLIWFRPAEVLSFFRSYTFYLHLGTSKTGHEKPWIYFLKLLTFCEWVLLAGMVLGMFMALYRRKPLAIFLSAWGFGILAAQSVIAYKTPWLILNITTPLALLLGCGVGDLAAETGKKTLKIGVGFVFAVGFIMTTYTAYRYSFKDFNEPPNRFSYVQTYASAHVLEHRLKDLCDRYPKLQILMLSDETWPYPFLLREYPRIELRGAIPDGPPPPVFVVRDRMNRWKPQELEGYVKEDYAIRPGLDFQLWVAKEYQ